MSEKHVVTELVEIPLAAPFDHFIERFIADFEPVLLAQSGIMSVWTGKAHYGASDTNKETAVSLTQWESLDAHEAFLASPAAGPFFEGMQPLTTGPPKVEHYQLGRLDAGDGATSKMTVQKYDVGGSKQPLQALQEEAVNKSLRSRMSLCMEERTQAAVLSFSSIYTPVIYQTLPGRGVKKTSSFMVEWYSKGTGRRNSHL